MKDPISRLIYRLLGLFLFNEVGVKLVSVNEVFGCLSAIFTFNVSKCVPSHLMMHLSIENSLHKVLHPPHETPSNENTFHTHSNLKWGSSHFPE